MDKTIDMTNSVTIYYATQPTITYTFPEGYSPAGKTFSLAIRLQRTPNSQALALAESGTVSGQTVSFEIDTENRPFLDAINAGAESAWLEIYVSDIEVLIQRRIGIAGRVASFPDMPPAPLDLYYTAAEVDALIAASGGLPEMPQDDGARLVGNPDGAAWVYGEDNTAAAASILMEDGVLYTAAISGATAINFSPGAASSGYDLNFGLRITQGNTPGSLTMTVNTTDSVWWGSEDSPPHYAPDNTPPDISTANRAYMIRLHWDAVGGRLLANLAYTEDV